MSVKPEYYKALWHNCTKCKIHFMSEFPHATAYLCDECYNSMPHYRTKKVTKKVKPKIEQEEWATIGVLLYILGCSICLAVIAYYLWWK
jgi:hypothetical protein